MNSALIEFCDVVYQSDSSHEIVIDHINLCVTDNAVTTIIGPNGAGKTTLLKLMLGFLKPTSGKIIHKKNLTIGYMPQKLSLDANLPMTVEYFLKSSFIRSAWTCLNAAYKVRLTQEIANVLKAVDMSHRLHHSVHKLSGGEWQRVLLARALLVKPQLLVLDEPVQCLDHKGTQEFYKLLSSVSQNYGCAVVQVSHDLNVVWQASDHVICVNRHICCQGEPMLVKNSQSVRDVFGSAMAPYIHHHDHDHNHCNTHTHHTHADT